MARRWFLAALATLGLASQVLAQAPLAMPMQPYGQMPMPMAQMPMPPMGPMGAPGGMAMPPGGSVYQPAFANDPAPVTAPEFCPDPSNNAPPAPSDTAFSLPNDGSPNAFDEGCKGCNQGYGFLVNVGFVGYMRQSLGSSKLGFLDPGVTVTNPDGTTSQVFHTGTLPPAGSPAVLDYHDVSQEMHFGPKLSLQWREEDFGFEVTGYYIGQQSHSSMTLQTPGQVTLGFAYFNTPPGFGGNGGLFNDVDQVKLSYQNAMASGEANFRLRQTESFEWIFGVRGFNEDERFSIYAQNNILEIGGLNPALSAEYTTRTHSRIVGPQIGFETESSLISRVAIGGSFKAMVGANFEDTDVTLRRGDFFYGPSIHSSSTILGQVYEANLFADFLIFDQVKLRVGYQALFLVGVPEAQQQVNFDLTNPAGNLHSHGSEFYHGPMLELQIVF